MQDPFVVRFTAAGLLDASWQQGSDAWDDVAGITLGPGGRVYVAGETEGELFEDQPFGGVRDAFLRVVGPGDLVGR